MTKAFKQISKNKLSDEDVWDRAKGSNSSDHQVIYTFRRFGGARKKPSKLSARAVLESGSEQQKFGSPGDLNFSWPARKRHNHPLELSSIGEREATNISDRKRYRFSSVRWGQEKQREAKVWITR